MRVRLRFFAWVYEEDVHAVCSTWIVRPKKGKENTIVMNERFGRWSHFLHGGESWIFYKTVPRPLWFPKSKVYGHTWNVYTFASYLWLKNSHNNREAVLNRSTSYSAMCNCNWNFSQTEEGCIKWHDKRFSFDSPPICSWKPESRQTSHNSFWYKPQENKSLKWNN